MSKEMLHNLIDLIPDADAETIYHVLIKFIPTDTPSADEVKAIVQANESIAIDGTVSLNEIDWN